MLLTRPRSMGMQFICILFMSVLPGLLLAQQADSSSGLHFVFSPHELTVDVGDSGQVLVRLHSAEGASIDSVVFVLLARGAQARRSVTVRPRVSDSTGTLRATILAHRPGDFRLTARTMGENGRRIEASIPLRVPFPPLSRLELVGMPKRLYAGSSVRPTVRVYDAMGFERPEEPVVLQSDKPEVVAVDRFGYLYARKPGRARVTVAAGPISRQADITVVDNPVARIVLERPAEQARTGDVLRFQAWALDALGREVADAPIAYSFSGQIDQPGAPPPAGQIEPDGRFVAETPGLYTITASSGGHLAQSRVRIAPRNVQQDIEVVGHGPVLDVFTSDLWVWQGVDGRDYAVTGTWVARGEAFFWDVTDPTNIRLIDTVKVDARTVNDVKVSEDGRLCVLTREGASNRRNGIVILDVSNPYDVKILSSYDDGLTGGVHNAFIYQNHVYAVNNGRRYDVINIEDPRHPYRVGRFELDTPGHSIHDVWIEAGIAYSSNWDDGVVLADVGGATSSAPFREFGEQINPEFGSVLAGTGSPSHPVKIAQFTYPSGWNHAAFPFRSQSARKFYVIAGDEAFPYGDNTFERKPTIAAGWLHFIDFTDLKNPKEVARFEIPLAGSHNFWVENDILYAAFYNGGLRVIDVSGELLGDLYRQGREIAWFLPSHTESLIPNVPMVWGPQPYKGLIYFSDFHTGLWVVKLVPKKTAP